MTVTRLQRKTQSLADNGMRLGRGFQGAASMINFWVIPQQAHRRHVAAALEPLGHGAGGPLASLHSDAIHVWRVCGFDGRLGTQLGQGLVGRAVRDNDSVFHTSPMLAAPNGF